jgi:hypothetical protein
MNAHEEQFARCFIVVEKQARYLALLESKRGRDKVLNGFNHCRDLDPRFAKEIPSTQHSPESIELLLRAKGAPDSCYVVSDNAEIDGRVMPLADALQETVGIGAGTLISCIPGKLAFFEFEIYDRFILER